MVDDAGFEPEMVLIKSISYDGIGKKLAKVGFLLAKVGPKFSCGKNKLYHE